MKLKPFAYLTLEEVKEFLKIPATNASHDTQVIRLINTACSRVEKYIDNPVMVRPFTETRDGNASNVIVPAWTPIREIVEIKIDFNRAFDAATALEADNYVARGIPDLLQAVANGNVTNLYELRGTDIVIRDDSNTAILGRLFAGSVIQSIRVKYKAGMAFEMDDVPDDLKYATLLIIEHLYMARENRDISHTSKQNNNNQQYSKETGFPIEAEQILDDYKDYTLGVDDVPQKNTFTL